MKQETEVIQGTAQKKVSKLTTQEAKEVREALIKKAEMERMTVNAMKSDSLDAIEDWKYFIPVTKEDYETWLRNTQTPVACYPIEYGLILDPSTGQMFQPITRENYLEIKNIVTEQQSADESEKAKSN